MKDQEMLDPDASHLNQIDIVSDVVCPWCIIGYLQLRQAMKDTGLRADLRWHPFELNPDMPSKGQNLREHLIGKYGVTPEQSQQARDQLTTLGAGLGFTFEFNDDSRMLNTFLAHQLIEWAGQQGRQTDMKLALFRAYFTDGADVSDLATLVGIAEEVGLEKDQAQSVLTDGYLAQDVRDAQQIWAGKGIQAVPAVILGGTYLLSEAQGVEGYSSALRQWMQMSA